MLENEEVSPMFVQEEDNGIVEYFSLTEEGAFISVEEGAELSDFFRPRILTRYLGGVFAIFSKSSVYNRPFDGFKHLYPRPTSTSPRYDAYSAPQTRLGIEEFLENVERLKELLSKCRKEIISLRSSAKLFIRWNTGFAVICYK